MQTSTQRLHAKRSAVTEPAPAPRVHVQPPLPAPSGVVAWLLHLQRTVGNAAVTRLVQQQLAERSTAAGSGYLAHDPAPATLSPGGVPASTTGPVRDDSLGQRIRAAAGQGEPLGAGVQRTLETALGADLERVRIHHDTEADSLARAVDALAFTTGPDIFFRQGTYKPATPQGMRLLAHEAMHTVQQAAGPVTGTQRPDGVSISDPDDAFEREAEAAALEVPTHHPIQRLERTGVDVKEDHQKGGVLQRIAVQRKNYYFAMESKQGEFAGDKNLIRDFEGGTTTVTASRFRPRLAALLDDDHLIIQCHGQYSPDNPRKANNTILWGGLFIDGRQFAHMLQKANLPDRSILLDIFSCFTAGSREEWDHPAELRFNVRETFAWNVADELFKLGYRKVTVRGYVGETKIINPEGKLLLGAGVRNLHAGAPATAADVPTPSWQVDFPLGAEVSAGQYVMETAGWRTR